MDRLSGGPLGGLTGRRGLAPHGCEDCFTRAFLLTRHEFQELEFPGALETVANGIALGQVVGQYAAEDGSGHGFLRDGGDDD